MDYELIEYELGFRVVSVIMLVDKYGPMILTDHSPDCSSPIACVCPS